jgi:predicted ribosome quality control (RQC) complex YloA/Tae2 family protein
VGRAAPTPDALRAVVDELGALAGARLQRLDVVDERELVLELRVPGRTLRIVACARSGAESLHLVEARPARVIPPGPLQGFLRSRLVGQRLARVGSEQRTVRFTFERDELAVDLRGGRRALLVRPGGEAAPEPRPREALPAFERARAAGARFAARAPAAEDERLRSALSRALRSERKKLARLEKNLSGDLARLETFAAEAHRGELLKTVMGRVRRGDASFTAFDWTTGAEVEVPLDPRLSPQGNLQRFFDRAKKAERGRPRVEARLMQVWEKLEDIDARLEQIRIASGETLRALVAKAEVSLEGIRPGAARGAVTRPAPSPLEKVARRFRAVDGSTIWVGRGPKANDRLTFGFAKGADLWLHARGSPGAHVLLVAGGGRAPSSEAVLDAAHLALHASPQRNEAKAEVMVTEARHVKKTKGSAPGLVGVAASRTLLVDVEPERLARLYGRGVS